MAITRNDIDMRKSTQPPLRVEGMTVAGSWLSHPLAVVAVLSTGPN